MSGIWDDRKISLDDFVKELKNKVDSFERMWKERNKKEAAYWPLEMEAGDWDEQFMFFDETDSE